jgi:hypothetical protein
VLISRDQLIAGRPAVQVREALRKVYAFGFSVAGAARHWKRSDKEAASLIRDLVHEGYVEPSSGELIVQLGPGESPTTPIYALTIAGNALTKAKVGKRMPRDTAQTLLDGLLQRVHEVNADDTWPHVVERVYLYGSFSRPGDDPVGDIDLAIDARPRVSDQDEWDQLRDAMIERDGAAPRSYMDRVYYPGRKLLTYLRGRSTRLDLEEWQRGNATGGLPPDTEPIMIYERTTPDGSDPR